MPSPPRARAPPPSGNGDPRQRCKHVGLLDALCAQVPGTPPSHPQHLLQSRYALAQPRIGSEPRVLGIDRSAMPITHLALETALCLEEGAGGAGCRPAGAVERAREGAVDDAVCGRKGGVGRDGKGADWGSVATAWRSGNLVCEV